MPQNLIYIMLFRKFYVLIYVNKWRLLLATLAAVKHMENRFAINAIDKNIIMNEVVRNGLCSKKAM